MAKKKIDLFDSIESLEQLSFTLVIPIFILASVLGVITHPFEAYASTGAIVCIALTACVIALTVLYAYGMIKNNFKLCFPISCGVISIVCLPMLFLLNGGFYSGMPLFILGVSILCCLCSDSKARKIVFFLTQIANGVVFYLAYNGKAAQLDFDAEFFDYDVMINYAITVFALFLIFDTYLSKAKRFESGTNALKNYVDEKVADALIDKEEQGVEKVQGVVKKVTVLFADIHNFTATAEKMKPEMVAEYVNTFLEYCDEAVNENHGILDKYIGDCAMAYWIDEEENGSGIENALKAALQIRESLEVNKANIYNYFDADLQFSAGLCYGEAIVGDMGSNRRKEFTVMGDTVNTASRIQGVAHTGHILVNETMAEKMKDRIEFKKIENAIQVKGKQQELSLYQVIDYLEK